MKESLQRSTPIWFKGLEYWVEAEELVFLQEYFKEIPPTYKKLGFKKG